MEITKLSCQGFCGGVKYALKKVYEAANNKTLPRPIYMLGNIIHNKQVIKEIEKLNIITLNTKATRLEMLDEIPCGTVIFSAHGVGPNVYKKAQDKGLTIIDATCPNVLTVHNRILDKLKIGYDVIYIGTKGHPEAEGVLDISSNIHFVTSMSDIDTLNISNQNIYVTNQTTLSSIDINDIFNKIKAKYNNAQIDDKICDATTKRQKVVMENNTDLLIVVGDKESSNSKKLCDVSIKHANVNAILVETKDDLKPEYFNNIKSVAITSGASTPDIITDEVIEEIKRITIK